MGSCGAVSGPRVTKLWPTYAMHSGSRFTAVMMATLWEDCGRFPVTFRSPN